MPGAVKWITTFNTQGSLSSPFYRWGSRDSERQSNLSGISKLAHSCHCRLSLSDSQGCVSNFQQRSTRGGSQKYIVLDSDWVIVRVGVGGSFRTLWCSGGRQNTNSSFLLSIYCVPGTVLEPGRWKDVAAAFKELTGQWRRTWGGDEIMTQGKCQTRGMEAMRGAHRRSPNRTEGSGTAFWERWRPSWALEWRKAFPTKGSACKCSQRLQRVRGLGGWHVVQCGL